MFARRAHFGGVLLKAPRRFKQQLKCELCIHLLKINFVVLLLTVDSEIPLDLKNKCKKTRNKEGWNKGTHVSVGFIYGDLVVFGHFCERKKFQMRNRSKSVLSRALFDSKMNVIKHRISIVNCNFGGIMWTTSKTVFNCVLYCNASCYIPLFYLKDK